jgi:hypothetical protein
LEKIILKQDNLEQPFKKLAQNSNTIRQRQNDSMYLLVWWIVRRTPTKCKENTKTWGEKIIKNERDEFLENEVKNKI